jgi:hypothetical protein
MSAPYLDVASFTALTTMPSSDVTLVDTSQPGYIAARIGYWQNKIEARLRKRYTIPFASPTPAVVLGWLADLVTPDVFRKRGANPTDPQLSEVIDAAKAAWAEVLEAANSETGLFDLPLSANVDTSAITAGGPLACSQASPYDWIDDEAEAVRGG